jgi:hypothetical protein
MCADILTSCTRELILVLCYPAERGNVHNLNIHCGITQVVRMVDYVIGRVNSKYVSSDPALFRLRGKNRLNKNNLDQERHCNLSDGGSSSQGAGQPLNDSSSPDSIEQLEEATIKMVELKDLAREYFPPQIVHDIISRTCSSCVVSGNNDPIDMKLKSLRWAIELKKDMDCLKEP